jgi:two-component system, OmpR family, response regulator
MQRSVAVAKIPHVLLVDDDRPMRSMLASQLRIDGFIVYEAPNILSARLVLDGMVAIDLVILDVHLPGGSGLDLAIRLRDESPDLPIVLMTAFPDRGMRLLAERLRAELLGKPFAVGEFRAVAGAAAHWPS